ncbi:Proton-dependent Oligopeptide Transporter (POT) Family [Thraustotheca clavata]|uniref:Proton-dependent Oligopeptide Transporter (POT) Family n=1 Tax=Thraustotheca clavata TaxID=74557 RepID=A0A1V9YWH0_9STRA|nr:Proton-dependent Oligopeptide Transporter (POT) Family [Thraustotheca clavata]
MADIQSPAKSPSGSAFVSVWDSRPHQYKSVLFQVCGFILLMEVSERLSYYGINQGLKNFMKMVLGWSGVSSNSIKSTWTSLCYLTPLLGAYLADERWGRFKTIAVFGTWYLIGDVLLTIASNPHVLNWKETNVTGVFDRDVLKVLLFGLFACIGVGTGAIKSNVITLGADQFNPNDPKEVAQKVTFFSYFYWCVNFGAAFSYGYLATLCVEGGGSISKDYGYFATFLICACVMAVALAFFFIGRSRYILFPPNSDAMSKLVRVLSRSMRHSWSARGACAGFIFLLTSFIFNLIAVFQKDGSDVRKILTYIAGGWAVVGCVCWVLSGFFSENLSNAKQSRGGSINDIDVDDIRKVVRVLPFAAFTVMWQCVYDQTDANFQSISQQTDLRFGNAWDASQLSGAVLGVFDPIAIVICIPVLDSIVYPFYKKRAGKPASPFGKVLTGLVISSATMFWVGAFETIRKNAGVLKMGNSTYPDWNNITVINEAGGEPMNNLQWGWNIPHYVLVALCECLINVTAYDVFYSEVPAYLKSTCQAINLFMVSMGSNVTSIFTLIFQKQIPDDLNYGNLEWMFYAIGVVSTINMLCFVFVMRRMNFGMIGEGDNLQVEDNLGDKEALIDRTSNQMDARQSFTQQRA